MTKTQQQDLIRQGDLLFVPVDKNRYTSYDKKSPYYGYRKDGIIQEGEATGHHHKLEDGEAAEVYRPTNGNAIVKVGDTPVDVIHQEHDRVTLDADTVYEVQIAREEDPTGQIRRVVD